MNPFLQRLKALLVSIAFIVFVCLPFVSSFAQAPVFVSHPVNEALLQSLSSKLESQYQQELAALPSQYKKDLQEIYKLRWENVKEKFDTKEIYTAPEAQKYLDALIGEIVKANPLLQNKHVTGYFSRSGVPNATYMGEGVILFNMGLFCRLDNESQAAFTLCHELSHFYLNHSENAINKYVATINSKEVQKELKDIKRQEYNKREQLEKLFNGITFNNRRHSRDHEAQADSMALVFMNNTRFDVGQSLTILALLDSIDTDTLNTSACLENTFNAKDYPFKNKWIFKEEGLLGGHAKLEEDKKLADTLKTHPDCKLRIRLLEPTVKAHASAATKNVIDKAKFDELKTTFRYEIAEYAFGVNNYTQSLLYTLELLQKKPSDPYLITQVGKIFNAFYKSQKEHTLSKYIDLPSPRYPGNYNLLLQFVQNLYLHDYANIGYHFLKQYSPQLDYYAPFKSTYDNSVKIATE